MKYLDSVSIKEIGLNWESLTQAMDDAVTCLVDDQFSQPIKPFLRFKNLTNRIIAMPAYLGNQFDVAGIKWIASFPDNIHKGIPRAHSVSILNSADTGEPLCIINSALVSVIRTVAVTRLCLKYYDKHKKLTNPKVGITGFGPIGQYHLKMIQDFFKDGSAEISIFDLKGVDQSLIEGQSNVRAVSSWEEAYTDADVFITCTVSDAPYINKAPKKNSLHLNISLRDYTAEMLQYFKGGMIVDSWEEICRENTDIERMHLHFGLQKEDTSSIGEMTTEDCISKMVNNGSVMFNPMGMAIFDIAITQRFYNSAMEMGKGVDL